MNSVYVGEFCPKVLCVRTFHNVSEHFMSEHLYVSEHSYVRTLCVRTFICPSCENQYIDENQDVNARVNDSYIRPFQFILT